MSSSNFSKVPWWVLGLIADGTLSGATLVTYVALGRHANWHTGTGAWPSVETLMQETGLSERTIRGHVKALTEAGVIRKTERFVQGQQTTNLIELLQAPGIPFPTEVQDSAGLGVQDSAPKQDPIEQDAAAVPEVGDQQQQDEDAPAETMEEAVAVVAESLGGAVVAEDSVAAPHVWVCDGCMRPVVREQIADMADGEHVLCHGCKDGAPHGGESIADAMARGGHGIRGTYLNPNPQPGNVRPFPPVEQRKLENWFHVTDGDPWLAAWTTACSAPTDVWYDPEAHLAIYLSKCREEGRKPRSDLWLRFFIEDRAKHIQVLQQQQEAALRRDEDPQQREDRSNRSLPPVGWGTGEGE